jgi:hypothetical protein
MLSPSALGAEVDHGCAVQGRGSGVVALRGIYQPAQSVERDAGPSGVTGRERRDDAPGECSREVNAMGRDARNDG